MWADRSTAASKVEGIKLAPSMTTIAEPADEYIEDDPLWATGARAISPSSDLSPKWELVSSSSHGVPTIDVNQQPLYHLAPEALCQLHLVLRHPKLVPEVL